MNMKEIMNKICCVFIIISCIVVLLCSISTVPELNSYINMMLNSVNYQGVGYIETEGLWSKTKEHSGVEKLIVGDRVANQLFEYRGNEKYKVLTGNGAMTMVWQYVFVRDYLEYNPQTKDVYLCITPDVLAYGFDADLNYTYLIITLARTNNMDVLEQPQLELLKSMYGSVFLKPQMAKFVGKSGLNTKLYLNAVEKFYEMFPKRKAIVEKADNLDLAETYIMKIYKLCKERNVTMHLLPNPKKDIQKNRDYIKELEEKYKKSVLYVMSQLLTFFNIIICL